MWPLLTCSNDVVDVALHHGALLRIRHAAVISGGVDDIGHELVVGRQVVAGRQRAERPAQSVLVGRKNLRRGLLGVDAGAAQRGARELALAFLLDPLGTAAAQRRGAGDAFHVLERLVARDLAGGERGHALVCQISHKTLAGRAARKRRDRPAGCIGRQAADRGARGAQIGLGCCALAGLPQRLAGASAATAEMPRAARLPPPPRAAGAASPMLRAYLPVFVCGS
jgi:hypothetical protein